MQKWEENTHKAKPRSAIASQSYKVGVFKTNNSSQGKIHPRESEQWMSRLHILEEKLCGDKPAHPFEKLGGGAGATRCCQQLTFLLLFGFWHDRERDGREKGNIHTHTLSWEEGGKGLA